MTITVTQPVITVTSSQTAVTDTSTHSILIGTAYTFGVGEDSFGTTLPYGVVKHDYIEGDITFE